MAKGTFSSALTAIYLGFVATGVAHAAVVGLDGGRSARLVDRPGTSRDRVDMRIIDTEITTPLPEPLCPSASELRIATDTQTLRADLDCSGWSASGRDRYVYKAPAGSPGGVQRIVLIGGRSSVAGRLRVMLGGDGYGSQALVGPVSYVEVGLTIGSDGYCSRFAEPPSQLKRNQSNAVSFAGRESLPCTGEPPATATSAPTATLAVPTPTATATEIPETPTPTPTQVVDPSDCCSLLAAGQNAVDCFTAECRSECAAELLPFKNDCLYCDFANGHCQTVQCLTQFEGCLPGEICDLLYDEMVQGLCIQNAHAQCISDKAAACTAP